MPVMSIPSAIWNYEVHFVESADFVERLEAIPERLCVVDGSVWKHHADGCLRPLDPNKVMILPVAEKHKCLPTVLKVYDALLSRAAKRNATLISIGGGILQDITGYVASTLYRGIGWIYVPTTLLAQADSCIGSKTSLNYRGYKNLVGTFYPPSCVYVYLPFLMTLEKNDFFSGLGEVIKLHLMGGEEMTRQLIARLPALVRREEAALRSAVEASLRVKQGYIAEDEFDTGKRNLLNFGHCFGHALESTSRFAVSHGQAVLVGILFSNLVAKSRGLLTKSRHDSLARKVLLENIVVRPRKAHLNPERIYKAMQMDKKRVGAGLALILMREDYSCLKVTDLTFEELSRAIEELAELLEVSKPGTALARADRSARKGTGVTQPVTESGSCPGRDETAADLSLATGGGTNGRPANGGLKPASRSPEDMRS